MSIYASLKKYLCFKAHGNSSAGRQAVLICGWLPEPLNLVESVSLPQSSRVRGRL